MKPDVQSKLVIISIFGVAIAMSIYAWWHNIHTGNQVIEFFGVENATRLRHADSIDLLILDADAQGQVNERFNTSAGPSSILSEQSITNTPGMVHLRHMFIQDHTYRWDQGVPELPSSWAFALRFKDSTGTTTLVFAPANYVVEHVETGKLLLMGDLLDNLIRYLTESKLITLDDVTEP